MQLIVAHVDHGIREESADDATFVEQTARNYGLTYECGTFRLGAGASELEARTVRWDYLRRIKEKYGASKIITAHHADDVVETIIMNIMRGTGWRGLASLRETDEILRPFLYTRKQEIVDYARKHTVEWREDQTNKSHAYYRNSIRHRIMPQLDDAQFAAYRDLYERQVALRTSIETEVRRFSQTFSRHPYIMWPDEVAHEVVRTTFGSFTRREAEQALLFIRTARVGKRLDLTNGISIVAQMSQLIVLEGND